MRSLLGSVLGHGTAREGVGHWWAQRITAIALVPLLIWLIYSLLRMSAFDYFAVVSWLHQPLNAIPFILFLTVMYYHSYLGVQVVIEDYLHKPWLKLSVIILSTFAHALLATTALFVVLRVAFGGPL